RLQGIDPWSVVLCAPVAAEIHFGLANLVSSSHRRLLLAEEYRLIRSALRWADWDEPAAERFGTLKARLRKKGTPIDDLDVAVASIALTLGASVATCNVRHFERIDGLSVEGWTELEEDAR
ncbi:MAG: type II toxin-antitoxin system VapC family toxin, partial [Acidobacteria bacterium]|nr:type II toxin-antitoxin system VapC family toxin [Acidobacteriota bacterium]